MRGFSVEKTKLRLEKTQAQTKRNKETSDDRHCEGATDYIAPAASACEGILVHVDGFGPICGKPSNLSVSVGLMMRMSFSTGASVVAASVFQAML